MVQLYLLVLFIEHLACLYQRMKALLSRNILLVCAVKFLKELAVKGLGKSHLAFEAKMGSVRF